MDIRDYKVIEYTFDSFNETLSFDDSHYDSVFKAISIYVTCIFLLILVISNISTFAYIVSLKSKTRTETMLLHLVVGNLFITFFIIPIEIVWMSIKPWTFGVELCKVAGFFNTFGFCLLSFIYMCFTIDSTRYLAESKSISGIDKKGNIMLFVSWIVAIIFSIHETLFYEVLDLSGYDKICLHNSFGQHYQLFNFISFPLLTNIIPSLTMIICYIINFSKIKNSSRSAKVNFQSRILSDNRIERTQILKLLLIMGVIFIFCWLPYNAFIFMNIYFSEYEIGFKFAEYVYLVITTFRITFVWLNPIIAFYFLYKNRKNNIPVV